MATNLDLQQQLNQLLVEQNKLLETSAKLAKDQVTLTTQLVATMQKANYKDVARDIEDTNAAVGRANETAKNFGSTNQDVFDRVNAAMQEAKKKEEELEKGFTNLWGVIKKGSVAASAIDGFVQGLRFTGNMLKTVTSGAMGLVGSLGHLAASIISIPFKMLSGLINMSDQGGGSSELQQALEDIRKEFGSLKETSGAAIVSMARSMKGELAQTGLRVGRIFGSLAERLKAMQEYAHNLGPLFAALAPQFMKNAEAIGAYYKGLGLTDEAQKAVAARSFALGQNVTDSLREVTNYSHQLSKAFNGAAGSAKEISRDMGTLMADFKHFGGISTKEIGQAVVYFRRLGLEVSKVMGVIEKYDNFEDAANGAAQLSQAFGLNVDALQMMKAQNPAERVEMLRKSFFAAGRSVESLFRQERALLAQQTGLDDSALDLVFSMKNQGMTYDQVTKKADAAKKSQMTQTQAMKALADSIERLVRSGGSSGSGGFFDRFIQGFTVGIQRSREFRRIMRELRIDLRTAYVEGIKVGRAFVNMFPGVKDVFKGIAGLFEPRRFRAMFHKVTDAFKNFFKDMTESPRTALPKLVDRLKKEFFSWFQGNSQNGQRILDGFKKFFGALSNIAGGLLKVATEGLKDGIKYITDLITGRKSLGGGAQAKGALGFMEQLLTPIIESIKEAGPDLWKAAKEMFSAVWTKAQPWLEQNFLEILGVLTGPALLGIAGRAVATSLADMFAKGLFGFVTGGGIGQAFNAVRSRLTGEVSRVTEGMAQVQRTPGASGQGANGANAIRGAGEAAEAATETRVDWRRAALQLVMIAAFVGAMVYFIIPKLLEFATQIQKGGLSIASIAAAALAMVATAGALAIMSVAINVLFKAASAINADSVGRALLGLAIIAGVAVAMVWGATRIVDAFKNYEASAIGKAVGMMAAMGTFFLAASAVVAIAAVVGLVATAGGGLGALVIAAGLTTIAITVEVMVQQGMRVMRAIDQFRPGPGFIEKARIFVEVMKGVGQFAGSVAQMVAASRPGILDFLRGAGAEEQRATLRQVESTITVLGTQIVRILDAIRSNIRQLSGSEQELKSAQIIGDLLGGVGNLANALRPPSEAMQDPGFLAQLNGDTVARRISVMTDYVNEVGNQLNLFMRSVVVMITRDISSGFTDAQVKAAQVIPTVLAGVGDLAQALRPSAALLGEMNRGAQFHGVVQHMSNFIRDTMRTITSSDLFNQLGQILTTVTGSISNLNPAQAKALQAIGPVIGPLFSAVANLGSMIAGMAGGSAGGDTGPARRATPADAGAIWNMMQLVNTFFTRVKEDLPRLVTGMREAFAGMNAQQAETLSKGMEGVQKFFEVVTRVPQMISELRGTGGGDLQMTTVQDLQCALQNVSVMLEGTGGNQGFVAIVRGLVPRLVEITNSIGNPGEFSQKINVVKAIFDVLSSVPAMIRSLGEITGGGGRPVPPGVLDVPLMSLNNLIASLTSPSTSGGPNPLMGGRLSTMLRGVSGISNAQKVLLTGLVNSVMEIGNSLQSLTGSRVPDSSTGITEAMQHINAGLIAFTNELNPGLQGGMSNFANNILAIRPLVARMTAEIQHAQFERISRVVTGMVAHVNQLSTTIRGIQPIEIEQSLQNLGDSLGLGSSGNYTIQNRNFTINLTIAVRLDNNGLDALELAMLRRVVPHPTRITHGPCER